MAFTLESALVIPLSIGILTFAISMALPAYKNVNRTAVLNAAASACSAENRHIYKTFRIRIDDESSICLKTSPSLLIDSFMLAIDLSRSFKLNFHGETD